MTSQIKLLTRAVILSGDLILLCRQVGADHMFLPGGHVEFLESAPVALARELREELGVTCQVGRYLGAIEHEWFGPAWPGDEPAERHEIAHFFAVSLDGIASGSSPPSLEDHIEFRWSSLDDLDEHNLLPTMLRDCIRRLAVGDNSIWWESSVTT